MKRKEQVLPDPSHGSPLPCRRPAAAAAKWWESAWLLPGAEAPLGGQEALAVHKVVEAFAQGVEGLEPSMQGSVADQLQQARRQV